MRGILILLLLSLISIPVGAESPDVEVNDQPVVDGKVSIQRVDYNQSGWMVVHNDIDGAPGEIIGVAPLNSEGRPVLVSLKVSAITDILYAMLHEDRGKIGTYEINKDFPVYLNDESISPAFKVTSFLKSSIQAYMTEDEVVIDEVISAGQGIVAVVDQSTDEVLASKIVPHGITRGIKINETAGNDTVIRLYSDDDGVLDDGDNLRFEVKPTLTLTSTSSQTPYIISLAAVLTLVHRKRKH